MVVNHHSLRHAASRISSHQIVVSFLGLDDTKGREFQEEVLQLVSLGIDPPFNEYRRAIRVSMLQMSCQRAVIDSFDCVAFTTDE